MLHKTLLALFVMYIQVTRPIRGLDGFILPIAGSSFVRGFSPIAKQHRSNLKGWRNTGERRGNNRDRRVRVTEKLPAVRRKIIRKT